MKASAFLKRGAPAAWPHEFTVIEDEKHPLFDERLAMPMTEERIRNFAVQGQIQAIAARVDGDELVIVEGRQRWKRATVINHVCGAHIYKGKLASVLAAIHAVKGTDLEAVIVDHYPNGMKLALTVIRGDERSAALKSVAANEQRDQDPLEMKRRRAQRMASQNFSIDEIREAFGNTISTATVKRWLAVDLAKPRVKKPRATKKRPGAKRLEALRGILTTIAGRSEPTKANREGITGFALGLAWALGELTVEELKRALPDLTDEAAL